jgi:hypothetical protein
MIHLNEIYIVDNRNTIDDTTERNIYCRQRTTNCSPIVYNNIFRSVVSPIVALLSTIYISFRRITNCSPIVCNIYFVQMYHQLQSRTTIGDTSERNIYCRQ